MSTMINNRKIKCLNMIVVYPEKGYIWRIIRYYEKNRRKEKRFEVFISV